LGGARGRRGRPPGEVQIFFLDMLGDALGLDRTTTAAFERGIRARNMTL
jgi:hypothetical protein